MLGAAMPNVIRDPRMLPYYLGIEHVMNLCGVTARTVRLWCQNGTFLRGTHYVMPTRKTRRFVRDEIIAWIDRRESAAGPATKCKANAGKSPALSELIEQERRGA